MTPVRAVISAWGSLAGKVVESDDFRCSGKSRRWGNETCGSGCCRGRKSLGENDGSGCCCVGKSDGSSCCCVIDGGGITVSALIREWGVWLGTDRIGSFGPRRWNGGISGSLMGVTGFDGGELYFGEGVIVGGCGNEGGNWRDSSAGELPRFKNFKSLTNVSCRFRS